jgi:hypothetical protein
MKTPFTVDQFLDVFRNYNEAVFPMQIVFYAISIVAIYFVMRRNSKSGKIVSIILSFIWLWMGIVYHLVYFSVINKAAYAFGILFILQGILFLTYGVFQNKLTFHFHRTKYGVTGIVLILFALVMYPMLGYFNNHIYPDSPTFGLPCPTTIFTFGLLLLIDKKCPVPILVIPLLWSIVGFTAAFSFGITEDVGLLIAGLVSTSMLMLRNRAMEKKSLSVA